MNYMGSKSKLAKYILPTILKKRKEGQCYVEPFVGGANMIDKVEGHRIGADIHGPLIEFHKAMQTDWEPPKTLTKEQYYAVKASQETSNPALVAFVGFVCSFGSKWWGGFAHNKVGRDYCHEGYKNVTKQAPKLRGVEFYHCNYYELDIPANSIIYCDPPYAGTTGYRNKFDSERFYQWCRDMSGKGHQVFISEYSAPADFECIQQIQTHSTMNKNAKDKKLEKLFVYNPRRFG